MVDKRKFSRKFDEDFKKSIVSLYENGKSQNALANEYGVALSSIARWVKQYSEVKFDDGTILTARQIKQLQKRNARLEEENLILKKRLPYSRHTRRTIKSDSFTSSRAPNCRSLSGTKGQSLDILQTFF